MKSIFHTRDTRQRFAEYRERIHAVENLIGAGEVEASDDEVAQMTGLTGAQVRVVRQLMMSMKVLHWIQPNPRTPGIWRMLVFTPQLDREIDLEMERQMRGGLTPESLRKKRGTRKTRRLTVKSQERVAVTEDRLGFPIGAVSGPERPSPLAPLAGAGPDAPAALVMAAKQYRANGGNDSEQRKAAALVKELNEIGVSVPPELAEKAKPRKDDRLEAIALVLPYIEDIERQLVAAKDTLRTQGDYGTLRQTVERQRVQIQRLVAQRTSAAMGETPHRS